jgi:ubiquinol-cytochrome c reductase cytochrome b subunit
MFSSILLLFFLPWLDKSPVRSGNYRPLFKRFFWLLVIDVLVLGWAGGFSPTPMRVAIGQAATIYYFLHFLVILPFIARIETPLPLPNSISSSVLHGEARESAPLGATKKRGGSRAATAN